MQQPGTGSGAEMGWEIERGVGGGKEKRLISALPPVKNTQQKDFFYFKAFNPPVSRRCKLGPQHPFENFLDPPLVTRVSGPPPHPTLAVRKQLFKIYNVIQQTIPFSPRRQDRFCPIGFLFSIFFLLISSRRYQ